MLRYWFRLMMCDTCMIVLAVIFFLFVLTRCTGAQAHNPMTHAPDALSDSYSDAYGKCCTGDDFVIIETWEASKTGYRIMYKGQWLDASESTLVKNHHSPDGESRAWIYGQPDSTYVRCFMPGAGG